MASGEAALALIGAAFMAGLKAQATKEASALGKELAKETAAQLRDPERRKKAQKKAVKKSVSPYHKHLGRVMKRLKKQHTKKNGDFKKGWDMRRIMASAHKEVKRKGSDRMAKKAPTSSEGKAHQLFKQCPLGTVSYSEDYPSTPSTVTGEGWEINQQQAGIAHAYWQGYIDLAGWSKQDLTMFTQAIDIQKSYLSRSSGAPTSLPIVKELDIITTRKLTELEITTLATAPGYLGNTVDLQEVIYGLIRTLGENISIPRTYQVLDVETWGSGNPTAMDKLHWTRIIQLTIVGPAADLFIYPTNLIVAAVTMKEKDLVWMERLRRSYVLQGEL